MCSLSVKTLLRAQRSTLERHWGPCAPTGAGQSREAEEAKIAHNACCCPRSVLGCVRTIVLSGVLGLALRVCDTLPAPRSGGLGI
ncbi:MAG: hypothetical protein RL559_1650 [Pseudomonadota bacterium]